MANRAKSSNFLDYIIKILIILLLSGMLYLLFLFISEKNSKSKEISLKDETQKVEPKVKKENFLPQNVTKTEKIEQNLKKQTQPTKQSQKLYTQEEMQEIIEMMIDQINELEEESKSDLGNDTKELDRTLEEYSVDSTQDEALELKKDLTNDINNTIKDTPINKSVTQKEVDHYNKVVINDNNDNYNSDKIDNISKQIGSIVDDITQNRSSSNYTKIIKKEVVIREDAMRIVVVRKGDTLSKISLRAYGTVDGYKKIFEANRELIKNPNHIYVGQRLRVPTL